MVLIVIKTVTNTVSLCYYLFLESLGQCIVTPPPLLLFLKPRINTKYFVSPRQGLPAKGIGGVEAFRM